MPEEQQPRTHQYSYYLMQFSYTAAAWRRFIGVAEERDRVPKVEELVRQFGGRFAEIRIPGEGEDVVHKKFFLFDERQATILVAFADDVQAAAFTVAACSSDIVVDFKTTRVLSWSQAMAAMESALNVQGLYPSLWRTEVGPPAS